MTMVARDTKTLLVTGASGFVGQALCREAAERGFRVRGAMRTLASLPAATEPVLVASICSETQWDDALQGVDIVIHLAARVHVMDENSADPLTEFRRVNVGGTERLARSAAASGVKRLVYVSSIKVNGEETTGGHCYTEQEAPLPQDPYGISKWEAEQALHRVARETGLEVVIVRPPLVYGAGVKGNFARMLRVLGKGIPLPLGSVSNARSLLYIGNFVDALLKCATHPAAAGKVYLLSDGEDISTPDLLRKLGAAMGRPARLLYIPVLLLQLAGRLLGKTGQVNRLLGSLQVNSGKIGQELGWHPPYSVQHGLRETAEWYRNNRSCLTRKK